MKKLMFGMLVWPAVSFTMQAPVRVYDQEKTSKLKTLMNRNNVYNLPMEEVQKLILEGADPNIVPGNSKNTLLCGLHELRDWATMHQGFIHFLLQNGVDPNKWDNISPLHRACEFGHIITVRKLIENKAQVDAKTSNGASPLKSAVEGGYPGIVQVLLENGAVDDIDFLDADGYTPKSLAGEKKLEKILDLFEKFQKKS